MAVPEVGAAEAAALCAAGALLLDVREPEEWEAGHAPAARHVPLGVLAARAGELPEEADIVVVCRGGGRSLLAATALAGAGMRTLNLTGGMESWHAAGLPVVTDAGGPGKIV